MVRQRMTALDIKASVDELRNQIVGLRLQNIYDLSPKVFLLKFGQGDKKVHVLIESGVRIHLTTLTREKPKMPSQFTLKLRKHVRSWRLDAIEQVGLDRAVDFRFGTGDGCHHFVVEFFSRGNFVLTDHNYLIMMLLRTHKDGGVDYRVREAYNFMDRCAKFQPATKESVTKCLLNAKPNDKLNSALYECGGYGSQVVDHVIHSVAMEPKEQKKKGLWEAKLETMVPILVAAFTACNTWFTAPFRPGGYLIANAVDSSTEAAPGSSALIRQPSEPTTGGMVPTPQLLAAAANSSAAAGGAAAGGGGGGMSAQTKSFDGSSFTGSCALTIAKSSAGTGIHFIDFSPVPLKQYDSTSFNVVPSPFFGTAAERFFLPMEQERIEAHNVKKESVTLSTRDKCLRDHQRRIDKLLSEEDANRKKGDLLQHHSEEVEEAMELIRMAIGTRMAWDELKQVLKARQREGHPVANIIHDLHLDRNSITVLLCDPDFSEGYYNDDDEESVEDEDEEEEEEDEDDLAGSAGEQEEEEKNEEGRKSGRRRKKKSPRRLHHRREAIDESQVVPIAVEVDLSMTAYSNAGRYFDTKKAKGAKLEKTYAATDKAVAGAERKGGKQAEKKGPVKKDITDTRVPMWFEKFYWFLSSFGHIVIAARDPGQADVMVKRYMKPGDFFIHSDTDGGLPCVVKNPKKLAIPMGSLEEAGTMAVCRSKAWDSKMSVSAWWVHATQVSKTMPGGGGGNHSYLAAGLFHIKGKKNFLPAMPLQLGCALLFRTDEEHAGIASHVAASSAADGGAALEFIPADTSEPTASGSPPNSSGGSRHAVGPSPAATPTSGGKFPGTLAEAMSTFSKAAGGGHSSDDNSGGMGDRLGSNDMSDETLSTFAPTSSAGSAQNKKKSAKDRRVGALRPKTPSSNLTTPSPTPGGNFPNTTAGTPPGAAADTRSGGSGGGQTGSDSSFPSAPPPIPQLRADMNDVEMSSSIVPSSTQGDDEDEDGNDADESSAAPSGSKRGNKAAAATASGGERGNKPSTPGLGMPKTKRQANKLKKIQKKYGEQDEDDRVAAMALLGNKASKVHTYCSDAGVEVMARNSALKGNKQQQQQQHSRRTLAESPVEDGSSGSPMEGGAPRMRNAVHTPDTEDVASVGVSPVQPTSTSTSRPQSGSQKVRFAPPTLPAGESAGLDAPSPSNTTGATSTTLPVPVDQDHDLMRRKKEEALEEEKRIAERVLSELESEVTHLTGKIQDEEIPSYCYAVVAPYSALVSYLYKVKLTPGHDKRGQAAKSSMHSLSQQASASPATLVVAPFVHQAIRRVSLEEVTQQFAANVKVHIPEIKVPVGAKPKKTASSIASTAAASDMGGRTTSTSSGVAPSSGSKAEKKRQSQLFKDVMNGLTA